MIDKCLKRLLIVRGTQANLSDLIFSYLRRELQVLKKRVS